MATRSTAAQEDLVCGIPLDLSWATVPTEHAGNRRQFCNRGCKAPFDKNPDGFVTSERMNTPGADGPCGRQG
jgi:YHS domain-containing protein